MREICLSRHVEEKMMKQAARRRWALAISLTLCAVAIAAGAIVSPLLYTAVVLGIFGIVAGCAANRRGPALKAGIEGEEKLKEHLRKLLGPEFTAFWGVPIASGDIDCLVVGPSLVWAIEAKNLSGDIAYRNGQWSRLRRRGDEIYPEALRSPSIQLATAVRHLKSHLATRGISVWVEETIVFASDRCTVSVEGLRHIAAVKLESLGAPPAVKQLSIEERSLIEEAILELGAPEQRHSHCT